jgi:hypothetical protein
LKEKARKNIFLCRGVMRTVNEGELFGRKREPTRERQIAKMERWYPR